MFVADEDFFFFFVPNRRQSGDTLKSQHILCKVRASGDVSPFLYALIVFLSFLVQSQSCLVETSASSMAKVSRSGKPCRNPVRLLIQSPSRHP